MANKIQIEILDMKTVITEVKITLDGIKGKLSIAEGKKKTKFKIKTIGSISYCVRCLQGH